jgi:hypothetical protein
MEKTGFYPNAASGRNLFSLSAETAAFEAAEKASAAFCSELVKEIVPQGFPAVIAAP